MKKRRAIYTLTWERLQRALVLPHGVEICGVELEPRARAILVRLAGGRERLWDHEEGDRLLMLERREVSLQHERIQYRAANAADAIVSALHLIREAREHDSDPGLAELGYSPLAAAVEHLKNAATTADVAGGLDTTKLEEVCRRPGAQS